MPTQLSHYWLYDFRWGTLLLVPSHLSGSSSWMSTYLSITPEDALNCRSLTSPHWRFCFSMSGKEPKRPWYRWLFGPPFEKRCCEVWKLWSSDSSAILPSHSKVFLSNLLKFYVIQLILWFHSQGRTPLLHKRQVYCYWHTPISLCGHLHSGAMYQGTDTFKSLYPCFSARVGYIP